MGRDHGHCPAEALLHLRRLYAFLKYHGLHHAANTLELETGMFFKAAHLQKLVMEGRFYRAHCYLGRFWALWDGKGEGQYTAALSILHHYSILASFACRGDEGGRSAALLRPPGDDFRRDYPEQAQRDALYCSMVSPQARASVNWKDIKRRTLEMVQELLHLRPNLERLPLNRLPRHVPAPREIIPLGLRGCRRHQRKRPGRRTAHDLALFLVSKRLPSSQKINHPCESGMCVFLCYKQPPQSGSLVVTHSRNVVSNCEAEISLSHDLPSIMLSWAGVKLPGCEDHLCPRKWARTAGEFDGSDFCETKTRMFR